MRSRNAAILNNQRHCYKDIKARCALICLSLLWEVCLKMAYRCRRSAGCSVLRRSTLICPTFYSKAFSSLNLVNKYMQLDN
jgi:hypothetical protein